MLVEEVVGWPNIGGTAVVQIRQNTVPAGHLIGSSVTTFLYVVAAGVVVVIIIIILVDFLIVVVFFILSVRFVSIAVVFWFWPRRARGALPQFVGDDVVLLGRMHMFLVVVI
jgi:hypothetical protein